jgi:hypothetical protein
MTEQRLAGTQFISAWLLVCNPWGAAFFLGKGQNWRLSKPKVY